MVLKRIGVAQLGTGVFPTDCAVFGPYNVVPGLDRHARAVAAVMG